MKVEEMKQAFVMKYRLIAFDKDGKRRCNEEDMLIGIDEICEAVIAEKSPSNEQIHYVEKAKYDEAVRQRDELKEALIDMVNQFAYRGTYEGRENLHTGGLSALESAFDALGISDPITILDFDAAIKNTDTK